jgi:CarboxypepD_reg-like domain/TonB-dependent Receptor Plug Domain
MDKQFIRLFAFTTLLFLVPFALLAQTNCVINGLVTDLESGQPLDNAVVFFDGKKTTITTDATGKFFFNVSCGEHTVRVSYVGYVPYSNLMEVNGPINLDIRLQNKTTQLEEVIVTSQGSVRTTETPALGVNLLSMKAVQKMPPAAGEVDILRGMQMLPGVSSVGEGANGINVRGGNVDQNLIYLDNMPIFNPTHMLGLFSLFPTDAIREMDIYKGSMPARYGGRTSAVLDVKMTEPSTEAFKLKGGIGLISNRLNMEIPLIKEKLSLLTSARLSYNEYLIRFYNTAFRSNRRRKIILRFQVI